MVCATSVHYLLLVYSKDPPVIPNTLLPYFKKMPKWPSPFVELTTEGVKTVYSPSDRNRHYLIAWSRNEKALEALFSVSEKHSATWAIYPKRTLLGMTLFVAKTDHPLADLQLQLSQSQFPFDAVAVDHIPSLAQPGMLVMDMDSTTIEIECIDEIAKLAGVGDAVSAVTKRAMQGELDFSQSLRHRVALLKNAPEQILKTVAENLPLMAGVEILLSHLQYHGWKVILASGGFTYFAHALQKRLGFDGVYANQLTLQDGLLTGEVNGDIVDARYKVELLKSLRTTYQIDAMQTMAVGDGANDLPMLQESSLGVALHAKPIVQAQAKVALNHSHLEGLLFLLLAQEIIESY